MSLTLILMRHAKSSWSTPGLGDHDRPLNRRGTRAACALGHWLRTEGHLPDEVLCSSALRTRQTFEALALNLAAPPVPALYHAGPHRMLQLLQSAGGRNVLMIGHNPGIAELAQMLVAAPPRHDRFDDWPTGATLVADFAATRWDAVHPETGTVRAFVTPRDLPGA